MNLYLMRHGDASNEPGNPLSAQGRSDSEQIGRFLAAKDTGIEKVYHSTKLRAKESAVIVGGLIGREKNIVEIEGLGPLDDAVLWADRLQSVESNLLIVSHMPFLPKLFSALVCGYADENLVQFSTASVVCIRRLSVGMWALQWMVTPELLAE